MGSNLKNIAVLVSGGGTNLQSIIDNVLTNEINGTIKIVISNRKEAYGLQRAKNAGIESIYMNSKNTSASNYDKKIIEILDDKNIDLVILAGYLKILTTDFIEKYRNRIINIHPSLIPSFCGDGFYGLKVHEKVVESGVKISGATTHFVSEITDGGPIIMQESVSVFYDDTPEKLQKRVLEVEHKILIESVKLFCEDRLKVIGNKVKVGDSV